MHGGNGNIFLIYGNFLWLLRCLSSYRKWFCLTFGLKFSIQFFMQRQNFKGTVSFGAGFYFITIGWPIFGVILEAYGFIILFSFFWPALAVFPEKIPILGWVFRQPFVRLFFDTYQGKRCQCDSGILSNAWEL
ncbi:hypothetical protein MANES_18G107400v8 [Manihot esculenta]|uniref:Uncharacterized protein n=3 Tax=Manihot esculenta TaxID=3983 RepID=A0ACB7G0T1_MANES|nr:hypothetical protein MANES_18G107400v8 [Manihot esculenta]KAG8633475.1 hypothetical protein MANES_18G107400v8 [Manihot esculenta]KAG8633476.1 hypothetical protein MANES_18G107400v8 [Manihot esculenta]